MDKKKLSATASSASGKHGEKKDENFLTKTAHSIRDKVHDLTDEVKEKTHNLTHSSNSKKTIKKKDHKSTDTELKTSSKPPTTGKKKSSSDSDDEDELLKAPPRPASTSGAKRDNEQDGKKSDKSGLKPTSEKKDTTSPARSKSPSNKPTSTDSTSKPSTDHKPSATAAPSSTKPAAKPSDPPSTAKPNNDSDTVNKSSSQDNKSDQVHISFDGVKTVNDLLDRIDDAIEKAEIVVESGTGTAALNTERKSSAPTPSFADLEKRPIKKTRDNEHKVEKKTTDDNKEENQDEEPIRINYNEIRKMEDLLTLVNEQPGHRKVTLENTPENSSTITVKKQSSPYPSVPQTLTTSKENDDPSAPPKSILKTSQDPSSLDTSTKTSSFQNDQIHVNIEGVQSLDDILDRLDDAVQNIPVIIDVKPEGEKRQAPQAPNQNDNNNQLTTKTSVPSQKREAPKAPSVTNDQNINNKSAQLKDTTLQLGEKQKGDDKVSTLKVPEHEYETNGTNKQTFSPSMSEEKKDENGVADWM